MTLLKLVCLFVITWICHASSQHSKDDSVVPSDCESIMKVIERLERRVEVIELLEGRVEALEAENAQQRSEITQLKAAMHQHQEHPQKVPVEEIDVNATISDGSAARHERNKIRRASPELTIVFSAALKTEVHHLGQGQNVRFDNVVTNVGNAYNSHVGVFMAPVAGVYVFSATIVTYNLESARYSFVLNGRGITTLWVNGAASKGDSDSQTIILQLKLGDSVSVQNTYPDHGLLGESHFMLSGFLLSRTGDGASSVVG